MTDVMYSIYMQASILCTHCVLHTLIISLVTIFHSKIITFDIKFNKWYNQFLLDQLPDNPVWVV